MWRVCCWRPSALARVANRSAESLRLSRLPLAVRTPGSFVHHAQGCLGSRGVHVDGVLRWDEELVAVFSYIGQARDDDGGALADTNGGDAAEGDVTEVRTRTEHLSRGRACVESNFGRPTPSTRRRPRDRVGSTAWRFHAIDAT